MRDDFRDIFYETTQSGLLDGLAKTIPQAASGATHHDAPLDSLLPVLPLRNTVLFPDIIIPVSIGRKKSIALLDSLGEKKFVAFVTQADPNVDEPTEDDLFRLGTVGMILKILRIPDGSANIIVQGVKRVRLVRFTQTEPFFVAETSVLHDAPKPLAQLDGYARSIKHLASKVIELSPNIPNEASYAVQNIDNPTFLIHFISSNLNVSALEKQELLALDSIEARAEKLIEILTKEIQALELANQIQTKVKMDMDKAQREFFLRQQLKTIQNELGEYDGQMQDVIKLRELLAKKQMPDDLRAQLDKEIDKLSRIPQISPDYSVTRNYLDTILSLPWGHYSNAKINLREAERVLNADHYGLEKVKKRILEYLAVLKLKSNMKAPILCFVGPPGVGKTSLGRSIAKALGRSFVRVSLGGVRDEAEIRGHRKTYIGAMPGRIIQGLKRAGASDPVFMLDEIDKLGNDFRGDPSSALLEVLDPSQNHSFSDHYLEVPYDLSRVMFIATANTLDTIPLPLRDRMEVIAINGYTEFEKMHIAKEYLIPRQMEEHGIKEGQVIIEDDAIRKVINSYTREAGVRNLERELASICRSVAMDIALQLDDNPNADIKPVRVAADSLKKYLGLEKFFPEVDEPVLMPGVAVGLAWTPAGGDILFIESTVTKGTGRLILTGQLGDVMKESAQAALSYLKSCAEYFRIPDEAFKYWDVHLHVPQGAIPKDGPSAGVSILTSLASIFTQRRVKGKIAMTGEITLRGHVLPVGGIKEKVLAAKRAGIVEILLPEKNRNDVLDIMETNADAIEGMKFSYFAEMDDLIDYALEPISAEEAERRYRGLEPKDALPPYPEEEEQNNAKNEPLAAKKGDMMIKFY
ncbi:MAG: endopeptidase La [Chloroherpetonaceae bacterium]|nr:endopeptidase La [Chloroherpetonaceae bacterium]MDW8437276.1 endopeptidase La [Chloroherpetonaceae bacterium]